MCSRVHEIMVAYFERVCYEECIKRSKNEKEFRECMEECKKLLLRDVE